VYTHYTSHGAARFDGIKVMKPQWSEGKGGNRDFGIYKSTSSIPANQAGSPVATARPGLIKK
jgi:hypothetical protein